LVLGIERLSCDDLRSLASHSRIHLIWTLDHCRLVCNDFIWYDAILLRCRYVTWIGNLWCRCVSWILCIFLAGICPTTLWTYNFCDCGFLFHL